MLDDVLSLLALWGLVDREIENVIILFVVNGGDKFISLVGADVEGHQRRALPGGVVELDQNFESNCLPKFDHLRFGNDLTGGRYFRILRLGTQGYFLLRMVESMPISLNLSGSCNPTILFLLLRWSDPAVIGPAIGGNRDLECLFLFGIDFLTLLGLSMLIRLASLHFLYIFIRENIHPQNT